MTFAFIVKRRGIWPVAWMCEVLGVSRDASTEDGAHQPKRFRVGHDKKG